MTPSSLEILEAFITDEDSALVKRKQGHFYPSNHHRISPLVAKAPKILGPSERRQFYFHLLRLNHPPAIKIEEEVPVLVEAYRQLLPLFDRGYPDTHLDNATGVLLFGFDNVGALPEEPPVNLANYTTFFKCWQHLNSSSHIPAMLKKRQKFQDLASNPTILNRVQKAMTHIRYQHNGAYVSCLWFWAMIYILLNAQTTAEASVKGLLAAHNGSADFAVYKETICRFISAAARTDILPSP
jgi:hypothetical protein